jgi:magnesium transporter
VHRTRVYRSGNLEAEGFDPARISDYLEEPDTVVWLDLCEPERSDFELIPEEFGLNPLAVEDATTERQRPKLDRYDDHIFLTAYAVKLDRETGRLDTSELAIFASQRYLITVRKDGQFFMEPVIAAWDASPDLAKNGVGFLLYGLLDVVVDGHFEAVQMLDDETDALEDRLFDNRPRSQDMQRRTFQMRKSLVELRRVVLPMREVVNSLMRRDIGIVNQEMTPYYQDVYDHTVRATEWTDSLRDLVTTILETHLTIQGNRLNEIMKKVTSWAAIIAVPTAVTGFYGQNVPYPGFGKEWGFWFSTLLMVALSGLLYLLFRWRDWL